jgi:hypothetical protein
MQMNSFPSLPVRPTLQPNLDPFESHAISETKRLTKLFDSKPFNRSSQFPTPLSVVHTGPDYGGSTGTSQIEVDSRRNAEPNDLLNFKEFDSPTRSPTSMSVTHTGSDADNPGNEFPKTKRRRNSAEQSRTSTAKIESEKNRRYEQAIYFASLQDTMLKIKPDLMHQAQIGGKGIGWKALKKNNVASKLKNSGASALAYNKHDVLESAILFLEQSNAIIQDALLERQVFQEELSRKLHSGCSSDQLLNFLAIHLFNDDFTHRLTESMKTRATTSWSKPLTENHEGRLRGRKRMLECLE